MNKLAETVPSVFNAVIAYACLVYFASHGSWVLVGIWVAIALGWTINSIFAATRKD